MLFPLDMRPTVILAGLDVGKRLRILVHFDYSDCILVHYVIFLPKNSWKLSKAG